MEEVILRVCVLMVSLLYIKDHAVIEKQNEDVITGMQERELLLQKEATELEQEVHSATTVLPHSNEETSQRHRRLMEGETEVSDVQQVMPNSKAEKPEHQILLQKDWDVLRKDNQDKSKSDKTIIHSYDNLSQHVLNLDPEVFVMDEKISKDREETQKQEKQQPEEMIQERRYMMDQENPVISQELTGTEKVSSHWSENTYIWCLWKVISIISVIRILRKLFSNNTNTPGRVITIIKGKLVSGPNNISANISLPESKILSCFYDHCVQIPVNMYGQVCEFVEGFMDELLDAMKKISTEDADMQIGDFVGVGSLYELWATCKTLVCDLYVPISAPRSYEFAVELCTEKKHASPDMMGFGRIKLMKVENRANGCSCMNRNLDDEDTLCLLHPNSETKKVLSDAFNGPLCQASTSYLGKKQVVRWFRTIIKNAWGEISHKYEFQLQYRNQAAPGALRVRFRSGRVILFNITPVVQVENSKLYLVSYLPSTQDISDTHWPISFTSYENAMLQHLSKALPYNSCHIQCLQILSFLHKEQTLLTGKCELTSYHLKSTLLHLLMNKSTEWKREQLTARMTDMLAFLEHKLQTMKFDHALVGNALLPSDIGLPKEFQVVKPTNIFLPLVSDKDAHFRTVQHFQELVKNAPVLIKEYVSMKQCLLDE